MRQHCDLGGPAFNAPNRLNSTWVAIRQYSFLAQVCANAKHATRNRRLITVLHHPEERTMHALRDLLTTDYGLFSAAGIAFMLGMGVFFMRYFQRHIREDSEAAARLAKTR